MTTIKEIALLAGVSRGTVDRVLNNRGSVNPEKAKKILEIAKALHYTPNFVGKALAGRRKQLKFGYVLFSSSSSNPFFLDVVNGIESRALELKDYGISVDIRYSAIGSPESQVKLIDELVDGGVSGLAITPINHPLVVDKIRKLTGHGFPVITVNSDLHGCGRLAYVGSDYFKSGETAAGLMNLICAGSAKVGVVIGSHMVLCHSERVKGFTHRIKEKYNGIEIVGMEVNNDDDIESFIVTKRLLAEHPEIDALFLAAAGVVGACRAVSDLGLKGKVKVISYDTTVAEKKLIQSGEISASITQEPFVQGAKPLDLLFGYVGMNIKPQKKIYHTALGIKISENMHTD